MHPCFDKKFKCKKTVFRGAFNLNRVMKTLLFYMGLLVTSFGVYAQDYLPYYHLINEARWVFFKYQDYEKTDSLLGVAFAMVDPHLPDVLFAAQNANRLGDMNKCYHYFYQGLTKGASWKNVEERKEFADSPWFERLKSERDSLLLIADSRLDKEWCALIDSMVVRDQYNRRDRKKQPPLDSINLQIIKTIIREHGRMPGMRELGFTRAQGLSGVLFHHVEERYRLDTLAHVIIKQTLQGEFIPESTAQFIDHGCWFDADLPYHFTRVVFGSEGMRSGGISHVVPVRNRACIDELRASLGLTSLERMAEMRKMVIYSDEEFEKKFEGFFMTVPPRRPFIVNCNLSDL
jgi:hypothetical protein